MLIWCIIIIGAVFLDQLSKQLAVIFLEDSAAVDVIPHIFRFGYLENRGAAWGMFSEHRWVFMVISSVAIVAILVYMFWKKPQSRLLCCSLAFIVAGGIGNMIDRIIYGYVVDFIEFAFIDFPTFNIADSFVTVGAGLLILYLILSMVKENKNGKDAQNNGDKTGTAPDAAEKPADGSNGDGDCGDGGKSGDQT